MCFRSTHHSLVLSAFLPTTWMSEDVILAAQSVRRTQHGGTLCLSFSITLQVVLLKFKVSVKNKHFLCFTHLKKKKRLCQFTLLQSSWRSSLPDPVRIQNSQFKCSFCSYITVAHRNTSSLAYLIQAGCVVITVPTIMKSKTTLLSNDIDLNKGYICFSIQYKMSGNVSCDW